MSSDLHSVLRRQLERLGIDDLSEAPDDETWQSLVEQVSRTYESADEDRYRLERSLDISSAEMRELHDELAEQRDRLEAVLAALTDGICNLTADWTIDFVNKAAEKMLGLSRKEAHGRSLFEIVGIKPGPDHTVRTAGAHFEEELQAGEPIGYEEAEVVFHHGEGFPAELTFNPILRDGELEGIVLKITDVTDKVEAETQMRRAQGEAQEALEAKRAQASFLANMSHELRTPLNAVLGYAELVTEEAHALGYEEVVGDLEKIQVAGKHLLTVISDVLDMSKIQAGRVELDIEEFQVEDLVDEVVAMTGPGVRDNDNDLEVEISEEVGAIRTDRTKLRQMLANLMSNAGKFTSEGTVTLRVDLRLEDQREWIEFRVRDTGIGIEEEKMDRLFDAFTQADESTTRRFGGTGLGLAICKNFCELLGGDIDVESEPGVGSEFHITLPTGLAGRKSAAAPEATSPFGTIDTIDPAHLEVDGGEGAFDVLVIDDDPSVHELIGRFLGGRDINVHSTVEPSEALEMVDQIEPDIIVLDLLMPEISGWKILSTLKSDPTTADIPVVVGSIVQQESRALEMGADDYLVKPFDRNKLDKLVDAYRPDAS
ncbi:MAG: ATP-binding protein [Persicimonas sp.]